MDQLGSLAEITQGVGTGGRSAGARPGPWLLSVVDSSDIDDDHLRGTERRTISVAQTSWSEKRLLRPFDLLVTGRSQRVKVALVPPEVARTVAASTLLVVRTPDPGTGLAHYLWYFLTSRFGRTDLEGRVRKGMTIPTLSASALAEVLVPMPSASELRTFAALVAVSDAAYRAALDAARIRHQSVRDAVIDRIATNAK
jgi:hypothetical protein